MLRIIFNRVPIDFPSRYGWLQASLLINTPTKSAYLNCERRQAVSATTGGVALGASDTRLNRWCRPLTDPRTNIERLRGHDGFIEVIFYTL